MRSLTAALALLVSRLTFAADPPPATAQPSDATAIRVACVGDSITEGYGAPKGYSYPDQLQRELGTGWKVGNFGVSGRTLLRKGDHPYWKERAFERAQAFRPNVVVILLGTNDTKPQNWKFRDEFTTDYRDLIRIFKSLPDKPRIYVCRPLPALTPINFQIDGRYILEEIPLIDRVAREEQVDVIDLHTALSPHPEFLPDRVHPNADGTALMAKTVAAVLTAGRSVVAPGTPD